MAGGERRQQIILVAMRLFSQRGFRGTTTKEIAKVAGVSEAMVFRHFSNKEDLYSAILDHKACAGGMADPCELVADAVKRRDDHAIFAALAQELMNHHEQDTEFLRLLTHSALEGHQLKDMFMDRTVRRMYEFLGGYIRERQCEGAMREIDPAIIVRAFLGMVIHHSLNNTLWDTSHSLLKISNEQAAQEFADILLKGVVRSGHAPRPGKKRHASQRPRAKKKREIRK